MAFDTQTVTIKGAELLAAATAANQLIIDGCDATTGYMTQAQAVNISARPASPVSNTTDVTQLGSTAEHINSRVYFRTGVNAGGDVNTLFLYGHSASAPNDKFVIFVASSQATFHLPVSGDVIDEWECALDIVYTVNSGAVGFATQATYCSLSEFNLLKERTVTTHKEGLPTDGDDQDIYGDKYYYGLSTHENFIEFENEDNTYGIKFIASGVPDMLITATDSDGGTIGIDSPNLNHTGSMNVVGSVKIGNTLKLIGGNSILDEDACVLTQSYIHDSSGDVIQLIVSWPDIAADYAKILVGGRVSCQDTIETLGDLEVGGTAHFSGAVRLESFFEVEDDATLKNDVILTDGDLTVSTGNVTITTGNLVITNGELTLTNDGATIGGALDVTLDATLRADLEVLGDIDVAGDVKLPGLAPVYDNNTLSVPIGGLVMALFTPATTTVNAGELVTIAANTVLTALFSMVNFQFEYGGGFLPAGKYRLVSGYAYGTHGGITDGPVLLQRVE